MKIKPSKYEWDIARKVRLSKQPLEEMFAIELNKYKKKIVKELCEAIVDTDKTGIALLVTKEEVIEDTLEGREAGEGQAKFVMQIRRWVAEAMVRWSEKEGEK